MHYNFKHIELFAGCGGMSLGLDAAGFKLYMANELSPMAGETFALNLYGEDLLQLSHDIKKPEKVLWIKSKFPAEDVKNRLRENPFEFSEGKYTELSSKSDLENKLIIGNIDHLLKFLVSNKEVCTKLKKQNIDLLSGGPPCQGFSLAGKRIKNDTKNLLPLSFANFAGLIQPKVILLENVKGITSPFKTEDGVKHFVWLEVAITFALKGFVPVCMLINSKYFRIPQNRPRFILIAFRKDIFDKLKTRKVNSVLTDDILSKSQLFFDKVHKKRRHLNEIRTTDLHLFNIETDLAFFNGEILPKPKATEMEFLSSSYAINDIISVSEKYKLDELKSEYALHLSKLFKSRFYTISTELQNHDRRNHSFRVKSRFRLYQCINNLNGIKQDALHVISGKCNNEEIFLKVFNAIKEESLLVNSGQTDIFERIENLFYFKEYLKKIESKKHSQRAIRYNEPAPAQMTIPDDLCHYSQSELRTLTVREMARFQSFPDWFVFRSKVTTGGKQRSYEVPQYTQVGNAVPPLLAYELGKTINKLLTSIK